MSCEDRPRSGRPSSCRNYENLEKVRNAINEDRRRTIGEISEITVLSWSSCQRMLTEDLNMKRLSAKFRIAPAPHGLECAAVFGKKQHDGYPSSSLITQPCAMRLFTVPSYERPDEKETFC